MADTPLTDAEIMALKPDPQPKPAEEKPAEEKKTTYYGDVPNYEDMPVKPNGTKGTVHARSKDGPPLDADGNLIKKTQKQKDEENRKKGREILDQMAKQREELAAKEAAAIAAAKAKRDAIGIGDIVGVDIGIQVKVPVVGEKSSDPKTIGLPSKPGEGQLSAGGTVDIGKLLGGKEGLAVTFKARFDPEAAAIKAKLSEENQKSIKDGAKSAEKVGAKYDEIKAEGAKIQETAAQMGRELKSPQEISDYMTSESAKLVKKYGVEAAEYAVWGPNGKPPPPKE